MALGNNIGIRLFLKLICRISSFLLRCRFVDRLATGVADILEKPEFCRAVRAIFLQGMSAIPAMIGVLQNDCLAFRTGERLIVYSNQIVIHCLLLHYPEITDLAVFVRFGGGKVGRDE